MRKFILYAGLQYFYIIAFGQNKLQQVNAILHDQSYLVAFGIAPDETINEQVRIQTHLLYVEQLLSNTFAATLSKTQQVNRSIVLDILHEYLVAGNFPTNRDYRDERRPCFIDADGNICAVGFLIEQTKGRQLAEAINVKHQYDFLLDMQEPAIEEWATEYGLTLEECAMIQPAYGPLPSYETSYADIKTGYGISSGIIAGGNLAVNLANWSNRFKHSRTLAYVGLIAGTGQIIFGAANVKKTSIEPLFNGGEANTSYKKQNNLSYINIALGTTTLISSALNLAINKKNKDNKNAFNLYGFPNYNNSVSMGLAFTRRI